MAMLTGRIRGISPPAELFRFLLVLVPGVLLLLSGLRAEGETRTVLWCGAALQAVLCLTGFVTQVLARKTIAPLIILLYGIALIWSFLDTSVTEDWFKYFTQAVLIVVPLIFFAGQSLRDIGAPAMRRARILAQRVAARRDWPTDLTACRTLPEVKALREALHIDAGPALPLLNHPRPEVQIAALAALDFRKHWRPGQAEVVLQMALRAQEPAIRAAAVSALANLEDRTLIESLAEFLRDPSPHVRRAAAESLLWDTERRWGWIRHAVRRCLGDPLCQEDGPLRHDGRLLTGEACADLTAWASEKGLLGMRAALTLGIHYTQALNEALDDDLILTLRTQLADPHRPPLLRVELARLLHHNRLLDRALLQRLLDPANPAPVRLIAVEALLMEGESAEALAALRELARLPNREIALATAEVVQRRLKIELGLVAGQPLPALHSRQATEISRRVMAWATQYDLVPDSVQNVSRLDKRSWHTIGEMRVAGEPGA